MMWTVSVEGGPRRVNHAAVGINDKIYSFGGYCSGVYFDGKCPIDVHELDTSTNRWRLLRTVVPHVWSMDESEREKFPYQRYGHTVCVYEGKAYIWGGRNDEFGSSYGMHQFDPATWRWSFVPVSGTIPPARDGHSAVVVGHEMYVFGGFEENYQRYSQETYVFDFLTSRWSEMATTGSPPLWRDFHSATEIGGNMYVFGGRSNRNGQFHSKNDLYDPRLKVLDLATREWTQPSVRGSKPCGRRSHSTWAYEGKMYLFGGFSGTSNKHFNDLYSYDPATNMWTVHDPLSLTGMEPCPRRRQCTVLVNDKIYLFGGTRPNSAPSGSLTDMDDLHVLDYKPSLYTLAARSVIDYFPAIHCMKTLPSSISLDLMNMMVDNDISPRELPKKA